MVLAWTAKLAPSKSYYWTGIAIPPALIRDGRLRCRIRLVAILEPHLQNLGDQAAATRVSVRLDLKKADPESTTELLGTNLPQRRERDARVVNLKWQPVRVPEKTFGSRGRLTVDPPRDRFQVYARVYWRHALRGTGPVPLRVFPHQSYAGLGSEGFSHVRHVLNGREG